MQKHLVKDLVSGDIILQQAKLLGGRTLFAHGAVGGQLSCGKQRLKLPVGPTGFQILHHDRLIACIPDQAQHIARVAAIWIVVNDDVHEFTLPVVHDAVMIAD